MVVDSRFPVGRCERYTGNQQPREGSPAGRGGVIPSEVVGPERPSGAEPGEPSSQARRDLWRKHDPRGYGCQRSRNSPGLRGCPSRNSPPSVT